MTPCQSLALAATVAVTAVLAACQAEPDAGSPGASIPAGDSRPFDGIAVDETLHLIGTEPFWGGEVADGRLTYTTPDDPEGAVAPVDRFAGRGGVSFSGTLNGEALVMTATASACSDGMSDRSYPFTVALRIGEEMRDGCGWTESHPFEGPPNP